MPPNIFTPVTVFNQYKNHDTGSMEWRKTILRDAHWEENKAVNVINSGLATADAVSVMVWFSVDADGKRYLPQKQYAALSPEAANRLWTFTQGVDRLIKGAIDDDIPPMTINEIVAKYDSCITIKSVDTMDYGRKHMQHWEVSGS